MELNEIVREIMIHNFLCAKILIYNSYNNRVLFESINNYDQCIRNCE